MGGHSCHPVALLREQEESSRKSEEDVPSSWPRARGKPRCCCSAGRGNVLGRQPLPHGPAGNPFSPRLRCSQTQLAVLCPTQLRRACELTASTALPPTGRVRAGIQPTSPNLQIRFTPEKPYPKSAPCKTLPKRSSSRTSLTGRKVRCQAPASPSHALPGHGQAATSEVGPSSSSPTQNPQLSFSFLRALPRPLPLPLSAFLIKMLTSSESHVSPTFPVMCSVEFAPY